MKTVKYSVNMYLSYFAVDTKGCNGTVCSETFIVANFESVPFALLTV